MAEEEIKTVKEFVEKQYPNKKILFLSDRYKECADIYTENQGRKNRIIISDKKKNAFLNGVSLRSTAELIGSFYAVIFSPVHLSLIKDGPSARRRFLDTAIGQIYPLYNEKLITDLKDVFSGVIFDNTGQLRCNEGESISDDVLLEKMNWYVDGVIIYE